MANIHQVSSITPGAQASLDLAKERERRTKAAVEKERAAKAQASGSPFGDTLATAQAAQAQSAPVETPPPAQTPPALPPPTRTKLEPSSSATTAPQVSPASTTVKPGDKPDEVNAEADDAKALFGDSYIRPKRYTSIFIQG